jgi:aspartate/tyrosine/aromatic aminotransferase
MLNSGRISVAGLNPSNIEYVARAFDDAVRNCA